MVFVQMIPRCPQGVSGTSGQSLTSCGSRGVGTGRKVVAFLDGTAPAQASEGGSFRPLAQKRFEGGGACQAWARAEQIHRRQHAQRLELSDSDGSDGHESRTVSSAVVGECPRAVAVSGLRDKSLLSREKAVCEKCQRRLTPTVRRRDPPMQDPLRGLPACRRRSDRLYTLVSGGVHAVVEVHDGVTVGDDHLELVADSVRAAGVFVTDRPELVRARSIGDTASPFTIGHGRLIVHAFAPASAVARPSY